MHQNKRLLPFQERMVEGVQILCSRIECTNRKCDFDSDVKT